MLRIQHGLKRNGNGTVPRKQVQVGRVHGAVLAGVLWKRPPRISRGRVVQYVTPLKSCHWMARRGALFLRYPGARIIASLSAFKISSDDALPLINTEFT